MYNDGSWQQVAPRGQNNFNIWSRDRDGHKELRAGQHWNTNAEAIIEFPNAPDLDRERSFIDVAAHPAEWDSASNDEWDSWKKTRWYLNGPVTDPDVAANQKRGKFRDNRWRDHGSAIEFSFDISPVPP